MKITTTQDIRTEVVTDVICDICGKSCHDGDIGNQEYLQMSSSWGYSSPWDTETWSAQVCITCVQTKLVGMVNFAKSNYM